MRLPENWTLFLKDRIDLPAFYSSLDAFIASRDRVLPRRTLIFHVFERCKPQDIQCVIFGEDPYPRSTSANGIAFWDAEIKSWQDKGSGNALRNIMKALLVSKGWADYTTPMNTCREIALQKHIKSPAELFNYWLEQGVFLVNAALTFSSARDKNKHLKFWEPFHRAWISAVNQRAASPWYVLWGNRAGQWQNEITKTIDNSGKIVRQPHPTYIHHFLDKQNQQYSPFTELKAKTGIHWL